MRRGLCCALLAGALVAARAETPESVPARALRLMSAREFEQAAALLRPLAPRTRDSSVWNLLGICESELSHIKAARSAFEKGLKLAPRSTALYENLGLLDYRENDFAAAKKHLAQAVSLGSTAPGVAFSLAASRIRTGEEREGLAGLVRLESTLADQPDYWTERGWVELRGDAAAASASFDHALKLAPEDVRALNGAASAAEMQKDDEKAISLLLRARKAHPGDLRTLLHFGTVCLRRDLTVDALDAVERARKLAPANNLALFLEARVQIAFQQWQKSHELFTEFDRRVPGYAPAHYALGWLDLKLNRRAEARGHLEKSLSLEPGLTDARYELGQLELDDGNPDAAEKELRMVLDRQPRHAKANVALGDLLLRKGDLAGARTHYETAIETDPKSGPAHYKLSTVLMQLNDRTRAASERALGASLNAEAMKAAKTVLVLAEPDGTLLTGEPRRRVEGQ